MILALPVLSPSSSSLNVKQIKLYRYSTTNHLTGNESDNILAAVLQLNLTTDGNPNTGSLLLASHPCVTGSIITHGINSPIN